MPRIICQSCKNGYLRYQHRTVRYGRLASKMYECDNCGKTVIKKYEDKGVKWIYEP